jgi:hypothetical protein
MLKLTDLIRLSGIDLGDFKIHCATGIEFSPLEAFLDGSWKQWQERQNQKNFECDQILSLIHLGGTRWLFGGVFTVLGVKLGNIHNPNGYEYETKELDGLGHLTGRAVVEFTKTFRASYLRGEKYANELLVAAIRDQCCELLCVNRIPHGVRRLAMFPAFTSSQKTQRASNMWGVPTAASAFGSAGRLMQRPVTEATRNSGNCSTRKAPITCTLSSFQFLKSVISTQAKNTSLAESRTGKRCCAPVSSDSTATEKRRSNKAVNPSGGSGVF